MRQHRCMRTHPWMWLVAAAILIVGHGIILYYFSSHLALSVIAVSGVIVVALIKHFALLRPVYSLLRRARRTGPPNRD